MPEGGYAMRVIVSEGHDTEESFQIEAYIVLLMIGRKVFGSALLLLDSPGYTRVLPDLSPVLGWCLSTLPPLFLRSPPVF